MSQVVVARHIDVAVYRQQASLAEVAVDEDGLHNVSSLLGAYTMSKKTGKKAASNASKTLTSSGIFE